MHICVCFPSTAAAVRITEVGLKWQNPLSENVQAHCEEYQRSVSLLGTAAIWYTCAKGRSVWMGTQYRSFTTAPRWKQIGLLFTILSCVLTVKTYWFWKEILWAHTKPQINYSCLRASVSSCSISTKVKSIQIGFKCLHGSLVCPWLNPFSWATKPRCQSETEASCHIKGHIFAPHFQIFTFHLRGSSLTRLIIKNKWIKIKTTTLLISSKHHI